MASSSSILDHLDANLRALGHVYLTGGGANPFFAAGMRSFTFETSTANGDEEPRSNEVVKDAFGIRSLLIDGDRRTLGSPKTETFHTPRLMRLHARPRIKFGSHTLRLYDGAKGRLASLAAQSPASDLLVASAEPWPEQPNKQITVPAFRLLEGAYPAEVELVRTNGKPTDLGEFLSLVKDGTNPANYKLFSGLKVSLTARKLPITITPAGIEFAGKLPDPTVDGGDVAAIFRLECEIGAGGPEYRLRLARPFDKGGSDMNALEARIASAFASLGPDGAPVSIRYDKRPVVPPLSWELKLKTTAPRILTLVPAPVGFDMAIGAAAIDARVRTVTRFGENEQGLATVFVDRVIWRRQSKKDVVVDIKAGDGTGSPAIQLDFERPPAGAWPGYVTKFPATTDAAAPLKPTADRLLPLYQAARAMDPAIDHAPYFFIPVNDGWVQIALPEPEEIKRLTDEDAAKQKEAAAAKLEKTSDTIKKTTAMSGRIYGGQEKSDRGLVLDDAERLDVSIRWSGDQAASVSVSAWVPKGQLVGFLYVAETSPTEYEALPSLSGGPAATRDLPLWFGATPPMPYLPAKVEWKPPVTSNTLAGDELKATLRHDTVPLPPQTRPAIVWLPIGQSPFITNHPLTRGQPAAPDPSVSRNLLPRELSADFVLTLHNHEAHLPSLTGGGQAWWNWGQAKGRGFRDDSLVLTTLAGAEFIPKNAPGDIAMSATLRFDLPILDELFAWSDPPKKAQDTKTATQSNDQDKQKDGGKPVEPVSFPTALEPNRLKDIWRTNRRRMALTRTQSAHLADWIDAKPAEVKVNIAGLVETYMWTPPVSIQAGTAAVYGAYKIDGVEYRLDSAVTGLGGGDKPVSFGIDDTKNQLTPGGTTLDVAGYAASLYAKDNLLWDSRGFGMAPLAVDGIRQAKVRRWVSETVVGVSPLNLVTMKKPADLGKPSHGSGWNFAEEIFFFARDLPLEFNENDKTTLSFDGDNNPVESAVGALGQALDQADFAGSLHEWRLFEKLSAGKTTRRHDLRWGPFSFRPLRLQRAEFDAQGPTFLRVVGSMRINPPDAKEDLEPEPFGPDDVYRRSNLVQLELTRGGHGWAIKWTGITVERLNNKVDFRSQPEPKLSLDVTFVGSEGRDSFHSAAEVPAIVSVDIQTAMSATFSLCIFGSQRLLDLPITRRDDDGFTVIATPAPVSPNPKSAHAVLYPELTFSVTRTGCVLKIEGAVHILARLDAPGRHALASFRPSVVGWLDIEFGVPPQSIEIDHVTGRLSGKQKGVAAGSPIFSLKPIGDLNVHLALAGVLKPSAGALKEIEFETVWMRIVGTDQKHPGNRVSHTLTADAADRDHAIEMSWTESFVSPIQWPVGQVFDENGGGLGSTLTDPAKADENRRSVVISIGSDESKRLGHKVEVRFKRHRLDADTLRRIAAGMTVADPVRLLAVVDHTLIAAGKNVARWSTLDHIAITTPELMVKESTDTTFAARFKSDKYRTVKDPPIQAGIVQMDFAAAGFHDSFFVDRFWAVSNSPQKPMLLGGSAIMFPIGVDGTRRDFCAVVPWLRADVGKLNTKAGVWHVSIADLWPATGMSPHSATSRLMVSKEAANADVIATFLSGRAVAGPDMSREIERVIPVEQAFFEKWAGNKAVKMAPGDEFAAPFFLRAMMALDARFAATAGSQDPQWQADSLHARLSPTGKGAPQIAAARVSIADAKSEKRGAGDKGVPEFLASLTALSRTGLTDAPAFRPVASKKTEDDLYQAMQVPRREAVDLATELDRKATVSIVTVEAEGSPPEIELYVIETAFAKETVASRVLTDASTDLGPSAALGWPSDTTTELLHRLAPELGAELPILGHASGFAGRFQTFGWPAFAPERPMSAVEKEPPKLTDTAPFEAAYFSFANHIAYDRGTAARYPDGTERQEAAPLSFDGPTARHLLPAVARRRAPTWKSTDEALRAVERSTGAERNAFDQQRLAAPIVPPAIERGTVGRRPGVLEASIASITLPADPSPFDSDHPRFGRPANSGPVAAHQLRNPRSPVLPQDRVKENFAEMERLTLGYRRRTYVSLADLNVATGELRLFDKFAGSADIVRLEGVGRHDKLVFLPGDEPIGPRWQRKLAISMEVYSTDLGVANSQTVHLSGRLEIGATSFAFGLKLKGPGDPSATLSIKMIKSDIEAMVAPSADLDAALRSATADTRLRAVIDISAGDIAPNPIVVLPLLLDPGVRRVVPVYRSTVIFGDPSYDRQLASQTASMPRFADNFGGSGLALPFLVSADRQEYDLGQTVYLAAGVIDKALGTFLKELPTAPQPTPLPGATLVLRRLPPQLPNGDMPKPEPLAIAGAAAGAYPINLAKVIELPLSLLVREAESGATTVVTPLAAGDRLELAVTVAGQDPVAVSVRIVAEPVIAPPPAVYSVIETDAGRTAASVRLHASAPLPQKIEFPDLLLDLALEHVRRRALFNWSYALAGKARPADNTTDLIKFDRAGGAQLPIQS